MKTIIYQMLPRYWGGYDSKNVRGGSLSENGCGRFEFIDDASLDYLSSMSVTHVWYTGVIRHSTQCSTNGCTPSHPQIVKGKAGSPYAISDYYDVNPYLASCPSKRMQEFEALVKRTHAHGMKVILDFVPNHVSRDNVNLGKDDDRSVHWKAENDFYYYPGERLNLPEAFTPSALFREPYEEFPARATGNNCFCSSPSRDDWWETVKINYCDFHTATWDKMTDILKFWAAKGVDGFRCDMVELVPWQFMKYAISEVKAEFPSVIFIGEVYDKGGYSKYISEVGFDFLYDKSGLYDSLRNIVRANVSPEGERGIQSFQSTGEITRCWQHAGSLQSHMLNFLENHDEQRVPSPFFATSARKALAALAVSLLFNNSAFMLYFAEEVGEKGECSEGFSGPDGRSSIFDWWRIDSLNALWSHIHSDEKLSKEQLSLLERFQKVLSLTRKAPFSEGKNYDLRFCNLSSPGFDPDRHFAFLRYNDDICYLVACNFSSVKATMTIQVPVMGRRVEVKVDAYDFRTVKL